GSMRGGIFSGPDADQDAEEQLRRVTDAPQMAGQNLSAEVSVSEPTVIPAEGERIGNLAVLDLGVKQSTLDNLARLGFDVHVLPQSASFADIQAVDPIGVFYS
ncbi:carbamoyl phosphate synthase small subunit, partial [Polaribacter sp. DS7-9]|nr:carbamoyl phosphate synthase small subunit [Polaribacter sp. DS7-9]